MGPFKVKSCRVEPDLWSDNVLNHSTLESAWKNPKFQKIRNNWFNGIVPECCKKCTIIFHIQHDK